MDENRVLETREDLVDGLERREVARSRRRVWAWLAATLLGLGLVGTWVGVVVVSVRQDSWALDKLSWVPKLAFMGGDFKVHIDHVARVQALGHNPYYQPADWVCSLYPYPPMIARYFRWVTLFDTMTASAIWQGVTSLIVALGCIAAWRSRRELGIGAIPLPLIIGLVLFTAPVLYAVERGQCDPAIIASLIAATWLLRRRGASSEVAAGVILGLTAWIKYYPGLAAVGLLALGRRQALAAFVGVVALIGVVDFDGIKQSIKHGKFIEAEWVNKVPRVNVNSHSIANAWAVNGVVLRSEALRLVPPMFVAAAFLVPAVVLVSRKVVRSNDPDTLIYPYFLWLVSAATFALPYSNDYNLATLPVLVFAVWDRRDRLIVHLALIVTALWSQPFWLPITGENLILLKLGSLYAAGACLVARASEGTARPVKAAGPSLFRPSFVGVDRPTRSASRPLLAGDRLE